MSKKVIQLSWNDFRSACIQLAATIRSSNFQPDILVAVARGGWIPTRYLSDILDVKKIASIGLMYSDAQRNTLVTYSIPDPITKGADLLLIEDFLETGVSLINARDILNKLGANVRTASLYYQAGTAILPDYSIGSIDSKLVFPWENSST